jgi:hypothetical protein
MFLMILVCLVQTTFAQVSIGFRTGVNEFTVHSDDESEDPKYTMGLNLAIPMEITLTNYFSVQPELHFTQKGFAFESSVEGEDFTQTFRTNFLELPVLLKAKYGNDIIKGYAFVAPNVGYALNRTYNTKLGDKDTEKEDLDFVTEGDIQSQRWEFSALGGLGLEVQAGIGAFVVDVRYNLGFTDSVKFENERPGNWDKATNRGCTLSVGYMIPLGR